MSDFGLSRSGTCVCVTFPSQYPISSDDQFYTSVFVPTSSSSAFPLSSHFICLAQPSASPLSIIPFLLPLALFPLSLFSLPLVSWMQLSLHIPLFAVLPNQPTSSAILTNTHC